MKNIPKKTNNGSVLSTNFRAQEEEMENWVEQREMKCKIYQKYGEIISYLEESLLVFNNPKEASLSPLQKEIQNQIGRLQKFQQHYIVSSVLTTEFDTLKSDKKVLTKKMGKDYE